MADNLLGGGMSGGAVLTLGGGGRKGGGGMFGGIGPGGKKVGILAADASVSDCSAITYKTTDRRGWDVTAASAQHPLNKSGVKQPRVCADSVHLDIVAI